MWDVMNFGDLIIPPRGTPDQLVYEHFQLTALYK